VATQEAVVVFFYLIILSTSRQAKTISEQAIRLDRETLLGRIPECNNFRRTEKPTKKRDGGFHLLYNNMITDIYLPVVKKAKQKELNEHHTRSFEKLGLQLITVPLRNEHKVKRALTLPTKNLPRLLDGNNVCVCVCVCQCVSNSQKFVYPFPSMGHGNSFVLIHLTFEHTEKDDKKLLDVLRKSKLQPSPLFLRRHTTANNLSVLAQSLKRGAYLGTYDGVILFRWELENYGLVYDEYNYTLLRHGNDSSQDL